ncbi:5'-methylthioadenosine/adenosylhomocysteine nucleosidase [Malikia sp.]|uniref:5'-methylthioadenosine/adenosylhomocysteine nucleosidase n=1 Tax=Malikia sp. TaxID=2070706 RepID=UPI0026304FBE|nr:5'-methylthioadenosine/adenosylhomocysteine nucleosidase [Malikia sp.]MDD2729991.1 5'-methylthioadenosine/adenosylhomocysteine nucleosidase [Malikia sp.]
MGQRIAIISALHEELAELLALMPDEHQTAVAGRQFWRGRLHGHEVIAVLSGIGKVAAATTTAVLLERFRPQQVIFTGVAGGIGDGVAVGDIVVGSRYLQHDMDASPLFARHELPGYGLSRFPADPALLRLMWQAAEEAIAWLPGRLDAATRAAFGLQAPRVHSGKIVTGDRFVATEAESRALRAELREALAVDMESGAVAQVCHDYSVPFCAVRTISDRADDQAHVDFPAFLQQVARHYSGRMLEVALRLL